MPQHRDAGKFTHDFRMQPAGIKSEHKSLQAQCPENTNPPAFLPKKDSIGGGEHQPISVMIENSDDSNQRHWQVRTRNCHAKDRKNVKGLEGSVKDSNNNPS